MSNIKHHLTATTLSEYASGTLNEALEVVVACHLTLCPQCRELARQADALGGYFMENSEPTAPKMSAMDMLNAIKASPAAEDSSADEKYRQLDNSADNTALASAAINGIPKPLVHKLPASFDSLEWKPLAKGIQQVDLKSIRGRGRALSRKKEGAFKLLKLQPGTELFEHTHGDHEMTLVLQGSYSDGNGRYGVGDVADLGPEDSHKPVIDSDIPCIALIASNAPAKYCGLLGRIIQPFVDI